MLSNKLILAKKRLKEKLQLQKEQGKFAQKVMYRVKLQKLSINLFLNVMLIKVL